MNDEQITWQLVDRVRYRRLFEEGVLIHQQHAEAIVVSDTAMTFLELCDGHRSTGEIIEEMAKQYDVAHEQLVEDLKDFINEISKAGIIQPVEAGQ